MAEVVDMPWVIAKGHYDVALGNIRIGELRQATSMMVNLTAEQVMSIAVPIYSDGIKLNMHDRRVRVAVTLQTIADELNKLATHLLERPK